MKTIFIIATINCLAFNALAQNKQTQFPGGVAKLYEYINKNMIFPSDAKAQGISGKVFIEFVVNADGNIEDKSIKIIKSIHKSCDEEAIRLISNSPKWEPAIENGKPVKQIFVMPIKFN
jgi:protein TonB